MGVGTNSFRKGCASMCVGPAPSSSSPLCQVNTGPKENLGKGERICPNRWARNKWVSFVCPPSLSPAAVLSPSALLSRFLPFFSPSTICPLASPWVSRLHFASAAAARPRGRTVALSLLLKALLFSLWSIHPVYTEVVLRRRGENLFLGSDFISLCSSYSVLPLPPFC